MVKKSQPVAAPNTPIADLLESWTRSLTVANRSRDTIRAYRLAVRRFLAWREERGLRTGVGDVTREDVEKFISDLLSRDAEGRRVLADNTAHAYTRGLRGFVRWCVAEGELDADPMERVRSPHVVEQPPIILAEVDVERLVGVCEGRDFYARRDMAIVRLFIATPLRRSGLVNLQVADMDLGERLARVRLKGGRVYVCPFDAEAAQALDRYQRLRRLHRHAESPALWLTRQGAMSPTGLYDMLRRRAAEAGLGEVGIHPHMFRHRWAHEWLADEGSEKSAMEIAGWKTRTMLDRYGAALAAERAIDEYRRRRK